MDEQTKTGWALTKDSLGVRKMFDATFKKAHWSSIGDKYTDAKGSVFADEFFENKADAIAIARKNCEDVISKSETAIANAKRALERLAKLDAQDD